MLSVKRWARQLLGGKRFDERSRRDCAIENIDFFKLNFIFVRADRGLRRQNTHICAYITKHSSTQTHIYTYTYIYTSVYIIYVSMYISEVKKQTRSLKYWGCLLTSIKTQASTTRELTAKLIYLLRRTHARYIHTYTNLHMYAFS